MEFSEPTKKVFVQTFGCQMNEYDTDKMLEVLKKENYESTDSTQKADLIILNTCSIREKAEQKVYSQLGRLRKLKENNPQLLIGVGGCVAQQEGDTILKRDKNVDLVFGTDNFFDLPEMLNQAKRGHRIVCTERKAYKQKVRNFIPEQTFRVSQNKKIKAHIAITKGCNNFCTFCIVPLTRGLEVSREPKNILEEAQQLAEQGVREIMLLGQNVNSYQANGIDFVELLEKIDQINGIERIRFTSPHPKDFHTRLADAFRDLSSLCEHMHLPIQAGSDTVLKQMKRRYTREEFYEKVDLLRSRVPDVTISTDLIVGFPGETDDDFQKTMEALERVRFDQIYSFKYSPRPGTPASLYQQHLEEPVKVERLRLVQETHERILQEKYHSLIGTTQEVMIEGVHPRTKTNATGRSRGNHSITILNRDARAGEIIAVEVVSANQHSLNAIEIQRTA